MKTISFTVPGEPVGKARPRAQVIVPKQGELGADGKQKKPFAHIYTPDETGEFERSVRAYAQVAVMQQRYAFDAKRGRYRLLLKIFTRHDLQRPDGDNVFKSVADAMNEVAYPDDKRITEGAWVVRQDAEQPRVEVTVQEIEVPR